MGPDFPKSQEPPWRGKLWAALARVRKELQLFNRSAVEELDEGAEETLTLQRLGCAADLGQSLQAMNCLGLIHALVAQRTAKVDHLRTSDQKQRWMAGVPLNIEPRLRRIKSYRYLLLRQQALGEEVQRMTPGNTA